MNTTQQQPIRDSSGSTVGKLQPPKTMKPNATFSHRGELKSPKTQSSSKIRLDVIQEKEEDIGAKRRKSQQKDELPELISKSNNNTFVGSHKNLASASGVRPSTKNNNNSHTKLDTVSANTSLGSRASRKLEEELGQLGQLETNKYKTMRVPPATTTSKFKQRFLRLDDNGNAFHLASPAPQTGSKTTVNGRNGGGDHPEVLFPNKHQAVPNNATGIKKTSTMKKKLSDAKETELSITKQQNSIQHEENNDPESSECTPSNGDINLPTGVTKHSQTLNKKDNINHQRKESNLEYDEQVMKFQSPALRFRSKGHFYQRGATTGVMKRGGAGNGNEVPDLDEKSLAESIIEELQDNCEELKQEKSLLKGNKALISSSSDDGNVNPKEKSRSVDQKFFASSKPSKFVMSLSSSRHSISDEFLSEAKKKENGVRKRQIGRGITGIQCQANNLVPTSFDVHLSPSKLINAEEVKGVHVDGRIDNGNGEQALKTPGGGSFPNNSGISRVKGPNPMNEMFAPKPIDLENYQIKHWKMGEPLGAGNFGSVARAMDIDTGFIFAVKQVPTTSPLYGSPDNMEDVEEELRIIQNLKHDHIVKCFGYEKTKDCLNMFLEYISEGSIASILEKYGALEETTIRIYAKQVLLGLEYLHDNKVIHKDLKGANILVDKDGKIKLTDFGCSKQIDKTISNGNIIQALKGSLPWMAPEVIRQAGLSRKGDIWSFGCTLVEMATAKTPWSQYTFENHISAIMKIGLTEEIPALPENISPEFKEFILACLQRNPNDRPTTKKLLKFPFLSEENK